MIEELLDVLFADRLGAQPVLQSLHEQREREYAERNEQYQENHAPPIADYDSHYRVAR